MIKLGDNSGFEEDSTSSLEGITLVNIDEV
jgi:hypothetical protein